MKADRNWNKKDDGSEIRGQHKGPRQKESKGAATTQFFGMVDAQEVAKAAIETEAEVLKTATGGGGIKAGFLEVKFIKKRTSILSKLLLPDRWR